MQYPIAGRVVEWVTLGVISLPLRLKLALLNRG